MFSFNWHSISEKINALNFSLKSYLLIYWLPFQILTSTAKSSIVTNEGRSVGRTVSDGQKSHNLCDFSQVESTAHC